MMTDDEAATARYALFRHHTAGRPALSSKAAASAIAEAKDPATEQDAAIALLKFYFTPLAANAFGAGSDPEPLVLRVLAAAGRFDHAHQRQLVADVAFNVAKDADLGRMADAILACIDASTLEALILGALSGTNPLHIVAALAMPYYVYGQKAGVLPSDAGAVRMQALATRLKTHAEPAVRDAAARFRLPAPV